MVVAAVLEVVLGDQLVVAREAVGGQHGQDPRRHDDAEVVVQARDGVSRARLMAMTDIAMQGFDAMTAPPSAQ